LNEYGIHSIDNGIEEVDIITGNNLFKSKEKLLDYLLER
jgi:hypothetical protein